MKQKIKVGLLYGGASFEHQVSKMTAESILKNIDQTKFSVREIYINKKGNFNKKLLKDINVAFLAVHGPNCEDGKLQRYLEREKIKYTGSGVEASRINMDKVRMHCEFQRTGLPVVDYIGFNSKQKIKNIISKVEKELFFPLIVKPNNTGSSIGVEKINNHNELINAVRRAFKYDQKIIVEQAIENPRELEISVLGNKRLILSEPGEILTHGRVYAYQAKYFKPFKTKTVAANLTNYQIKEIKRMAKSAYLATGCCGYARIDFLMDKNGQIFISEINTLPGFTKISMFPKMMEVKGIKYKDLITRIINLAL